MTQHKTTTHDDNSFCYSGERFADIQMLRYRLNGFDELPLQKKKYIYYLSEATLAGRDITTDQFGFYNLRIRKTLEAIYQHYDGDRADAEFQAMETYLKQVWFSNGIYHHYGCGKFTPGFTERFFRQALSSISPSLLPLADGETAESLLDILVPIIFNPDILPKRVNKAEGADLVLTSACNYYIGVSQAEVEEYYGKLKEQAGERPPSFGLNSRLVKTDGALREELWTANGLYSPAIRHIIGCLRKAADHAENEQQRHVIALLISYYETGDLHTFDEYSIQWLREQAGMVDFINGFIEVYGDPLGIKASWEGIVEYKDLEATRRTRAISDNAQWFEDHSPVDPRFRKSTVRGVTANVVCAAMLGGDEYPSTAIGINLPNADWIRAEHGSKSVTIGNITEAYNKAAHGNGMLEEFVIDRETLDIINQYGDLCDELHTDLHECLGHGSGQLLPGVSADALRAYGNTIEEARADLFGLYYMADEKMLELGLLNDKDAYKAHYYTYMLNGLMTQLRRITPGNDIEEAHMRNRALIAHWVLEHSDGAVQMVSRDGKTHVVVNDYDVLRQLFAKLLAEVQRIKSEGDYAAAKALVERYAVKVDRQLLEEVHERYEKLDIAPYKGFLNPRLSLSHDADGQVCDVLIDYTESYEHQMLRYSSEYGFLQ